MSDLRNLLLDCRSALRRAIRRFDDDPLRVKLDEAINEFSKPKEDADELAEPETRTAQQVAYAWQIAVRSVKMTHPDLYAKLAKRVNQMLDTEVLQDPATEFLNMEAKLESAVTGHKDVEKELTELRLALSDAVPLAGADAKGTEAERALRRIQILINAVAKGSVKPVAAPVNDNPFDMAQSRADLSAVAAGKRPLTKWERSWCVAEALVLTEMKEAQLKTLQDVELVKLVLASS